MNLYNSSIGTRLKCGFGMVLAMCAVLALVAWMQIQKIGTIVYEINDSWMVSVIQLNTMRDALADLRRSELRIVIVSDEQRWDAEDGARAEALRHFEAAVKPYEATGISGPPEQKLYDAFRATLDQYKKTWPTLRALARGGNDKHAAAVAHLLGDSKRTFEAAMAALNRDIEFNVVGSAGARDSANATLSRAVLHLALTMVTILVLGGSAAWWLTRSIVRPLRDAIGVARVIASGDLSNAIHSSAKDETGQLLQALSEMQTQLRDTIAGIQQSADQVGTASTQIATGNSDLSSRTEQQASSLQQTAASMEQLTATIANGANSARQANQLATSAVQFAEQGGSVVGQVVETMSGISTSSKRIADIIGVIDGIAFQTNILALNAAVEAARAGEQGRGFAVVAAEVRTLAQRSAQAAKEIKALIDESVQRVDAGGHLVQRAGASMTDIVGAVRKVTDLIAEVSAAAGEQDAGIRQINSAVGNLDQATQQNAALVEESAAAAESLRDQARQLAQAVGRFRLQAA